MHRNAPSPKLVALGEEAFSCVTLSDQMFVLFAKLIPEGVKGLIVRAMNNMTESIHNNQNPSKAVENRISLLMQHGVGDLLEWQKLSFVVRSSKAQTYALALIHIEAKQILLVGPKFCQNSHLPSPLSHYRLDQRGNPAKHKQRLRFFRARLLMLIL